MLLRLRLRLAAGGEKLRLALRRTHVVPCAGRPTAGQAASGGHLRVALLLGGRLLLLLLLVLGGLWAEAGIAGLVGGQVRAVVVR